MRPARFNFHQTTSLKEACILSKQGAIPMCRGAGSGPRHAIKKLRSSRDNQLEANRRNFPKISFKHNSLIIGAKVTVTELLEDKNVLERIPVLSEAQEVGGRTNKKFATVVGNVCWSDPRANLAVALLACRAK